MIKKVRHPNFSYYCKQITGLFEGNAKVAEDKLNILLEKYVSTECLSTSAPQENYYLGFMNGVLRKDISLIEEQNSNLESGNGSMDLIVKYRNDI